MNKIFRKAITVLGSAALIGMTVSAAAAASYPTPFTSNTAIVVGTGAMQQDTTGAVDIAADLGARNAGVIGGALGGTITGKSQSLASGSDLLYLNDDLAENVQTITKSDLPTVLADGTFTDDDGTDYGYEQTLTVGASTTNGFAFSNSDNDLDDPALILALSTSTSTPIYNLTANFNTAIPFNATASEGEDITLFGKTYTVGTATDADTLVLLGGAGSANINVGDSQSITVGDETFDVSLNGLSSDSVASVAVNGETKTFTQGQTKEVGGVDVYVKTIFRTGDDTGYAEIQLGAGKLTFEDGNAVQTGSDNDDIEGTLVTMTGGANATTTLTISVVAADNDGNHLLVGDSFADPVFGTIVVNFDSVENGPTFVGEKDTGRTDLEIQKGGNRELQLMLTDNADNTATIPFVYQNATADDDGNAIHLVEGATISDEEYFILNSGNYQYFMQMTKVDADSSGQVTFKDQLSGESYGTGSGANIETSDTVTINNQVFTITTVSSTSVTVTSSDYKLTNGGLVDVFPMLELVSGEDTRVAMTDNVTALTGINATDTALTITLTLPTGTIDVVGAAVTDTVTIGTTDITVGADTAIKVGDVYYDFGVVEGNGVNMTNVTVAMNEVISSGATNVSVTTPGLLFVEDEDKSDGTTKTAIHIVTTDAGTYSTVSSPVFSGTSGDEDFDTETFDDTDFTGWLTNYGTYVWKDTSDSNNYLVGLSYGDDMMDAIVYVAEGEAVEATTVTDVGVKTYTDAQAGSFAGMNLIVVGGSAINSVAADLLGGAYSEGDFTSQTDVAAGEFLIKSFKRTTGEMALLVAGYNAADTEKAVKVLLNDVINTAEGMEYKGVSSTEAITVVN